MRRRIILAFVLTVFLASAGFCSEDYRDGYVLVRFNQGSSGSLSFSQKLLALNSVLSDSTIVRSYGLVEDLCLVELSGGVDVPSAVSAFISSPAILYAEPDYIHHVANTPNDTMFDDLWGMHNTGQTGGVIDSDIDATEAWDIHTGTKDIIVAVLDTGVDYTHPDLVGNMWVNQQEYSGVTGVDDDGNGYVDDIYGYDFGGALIADSSDYDGDPNDQNLHGTHVAGTIGAVGNNGIGVTGVCWTTSIMAVKISPDDANSSMTSSDEIAGIEYAVANGAKVINASWGGVNYNNSLRAAIEAAGNAGVLFVAAAGNDGTNNDASHRYPSDYDLDNIISVAATDSSDLMANFSNYGSTSVDIGAPGDQILSTFPTYVTQDMNLGGLATDYGTISGTSMAAPHVAGAAAFIWSFVPMLEYSEVKNILLDSAEPIASLNGLTVTGGRLNLNEALNAIGPKILNKRTGVVYDKIQAAIDDPLTLDGDVIVADKGTDLTSAVYYYGSIDFKGKAITLRSGSIYLPNDETLYPERTFLLADIDNRAVQFVNGEGAGSVLKGFTISRGVATGEGPFDNYGGGIYMDGSSPIISDCIISENSAGLEGGGIYCDDQSDPEIINCIIKNNVASRDGGGIYTYDSSPYIKNCLIVHNKAYRDGGGFYLNGQDGANQLELLNSTISDNSVGNVNGLGGAVYSFYGAQPVITDCIISNNNGYAIFEKDFPSLGLESDVYMNYCLFYDNSDGDYWDADTAAVYTGLLGLNGLSQLAEVSVAYVGDPIYVSGRLGDYYISQVSAGQLVDSNGLDRGSDLASNLGMDIYSTRTDNVGDGSVVDLGYHYNDPELPVLFGLTTFVTPSGEGTITPVPGVTHYYPQYSCVHLVASEIGTDAEYQLKAWHGTDDDSKRTLGEDGYPLKDQTNTVIMDSDKIVTAEFEYKKVTLRVKVLSDNADVILTPEPERRDMYTRGTEVTITVVPMNPSQRITWSGSDDDSSRQYSNTIVMNTTRFVDVSLEDPRTLIVGGGGIPGAYSDVGDAIADSEEGDTIIVSQGVWSITNDNSWAISDKNITIRSTNPDDPIIVAQTVFQDRIFYENVNNKSVLKGITFRDMSTGGAIASDGDQATECDGYNGGHTYGGALVIGYDNLLTLELDMAEAVDMNEASPKIINCIFDNISVRGGHGGNACVGGDGGWGGKAYGGAIYVGPECNPIFENVTFVNCTADGGDGGNPSGGLAGSWNEPREDHWFFGPYDENWNYTGRGGAVYIDFNTAPVFKDCLFQDNTALGGSSGGVHYKIHRYGGAVFLASKSYAEFTNCDFINNVADSNENTSWRGRGGGAATATTEADPYISYGGAVGMESYTYSIDPDDSNEPGSVEVFFQGGCPVFEDCNFSGSYADVGGIMHLEQTYDINFPTLIINRCRFEDSNAYDGGAIYSSEMVYDIYESVFANNWTHTISGQGGAIFAHSGFARVYDSVFSSNSALTSGGAMYLSDSNALLWNCLIEGNEAARDGGGVSVNIFSDCNMLYTTIANNFGGMYGGGLYTSYNSFSRVRDSIIWGNFASGGHQLAIGSGNEYDPEPSVVEVSHSVVGPKYGVLAMSSEQGVDDNAVNLLEGDAITATISSSGTADIIVHLYEPYTLKDTIDWDDPADLAALHSDISTRQVSVLSTLMASEFTECYRYENIAAFSGSVTASGLAKLLANPQVHHIAPVHELHFMMNQGLALADAMSYRSQYSGDGVSIAIVDSGVDYRHNSLGGSASEIDFPNDKVIGGYDFGEDDELPFPNTEAHGTACAGIAAGDLDDYEDYVGGVAYGAKIYALKIADVNDIPNEDAAIAAWDWCISNKNLDPDNPILVISNSWGFSLEIDDSATAQALYPSFAEAARIATKAGMVVMAASGNDGYTNGIGIPAAIEDVVSVGAVYDTTDEVTEYSNAGELLDILAPADPLYTTDIKGTSGYSYGDYFDSFAGTSAACPFAAGFVAVVQQAAKETLGTYLSPMQVEMLIEASGDQVLDSKVDITKPRVNLAEAIDSMTAGPIYIENGSSIRYDWWYPETLTWDGNSYNLPVDDDPCFVDGYYLSQITSGQDMDSDAVDAGSAYAHDAGLYRHTTRTDWAVEYVGDGTAPDFGSIADMGYHYVRSTDFVSDLNYDGIIDLGDVLRYYIHYLDEDCGFPDWCHGVDINKDGLVNNRDYAYIANDVNEQLRETVAPLPDPMRWKVAPRSQAGQSWAKMEAYKATDNYGGVIMYQIERFYPVINRDYTDDSNSNYHIGTSPVFVDTEVAVGQEYGYRVRAIDARENMTAWSFLRYVEVGAESVPLAPGDLTGYMIGLDQVRLNWNDYSDNETAFNVERKSGDEEFEVIGSSAANDPTYLDATVLCGNQYLYRVNAVNSAGGSDYTNLLLMQMEDCPPEPNLPVMREGPDDDPNSHLEKDADDGYWYHLVVADVPDLGGADAVYFRFVCKENIFSFPKAGEDWLDAASAGAYEHPIPGLPDVEVEINGTEVSLRIYVANNYSGQNLKWKVCASYNVDGSDPVVCPEFILVTMPLP